MRKLYNLATFLLLGHFPSAFSQQQFVGTLVRDEEMILPKCCGGGDLKNVNGSLICIGDEKKSSIEVGFSGITREYPVQGSGMPFCKSELEAWYPEQSESLSESSSLLTEDGVLIHEDHWYRKDSFCVDHLIDSDYGEDLRNVVVLYCVPKGERCCQPWARLDQDVQFCSHHQDGQLQKKSSTGYIYNSLQCNQLMNSSVYTMEERGIEINGNFVSRTQYCLDSERHVVYYCADELQPNKKSSSEPTSNSSINQFLAFNSILISIFIMMLSNSKYL
ncbi:uncharacterized protein LOC111710659 isoform X2 [Eurytemora carolleeae]|uniref:uncharacterized protein LOC111710659 isoform X2 n=1 Tax=Eurytemora carolleeae TaxID=1294199 RepID=UPI000C7690D8|nr:uncharacterized protein LOC111710659 isoform X2 [Eurytemora carolleeae]|eukprot:XP_023340550.1 uncharacterized protein LOC111710659 isoform X2 [Eurytemora affinis]